MRPLTTTTAPVRAVTRTESPTAGCTAPSATLRSWRIGLGQLTLAAIVSVIALPACSAHAQARDTLSPARFTALESVYSAFLPLDQSISAGSVANLRRTCIALDRSDRLLAAARKECLTGVKVITRSAAFASCVGRTRCRQTAGHLATALSETIVIARE